ncbi:MAG: GntR family transcriptional regulator [Pseudomonadota bacterium]
MEPVIPDRTKTKRRLRAHDILPRVPALHVQIADVVRDRIVEGQFEPGDFLDEAELASELKVSRTPIREALKVLSHEGLVENQPNRGTFVAHLSLQTATDLLELLAEVEGFGGELAATRADASTLVDLSERHARMISAYQRKDKPAYFKLNAGIHEAIAQASANRELHHTFVRLTDRLRRLRFLSNSTEALWQASIAEHEAIQAHLEQRDGKAVRALLRDHVLAILPRVADILRQDSERLD